MKHSDLLPLAQQLVDAHFDVLRKTVRRNLTRLTVAFLCLAVSVRFGYGGLHLTSIARALPDGAKVKNGYKWLSRFLKCKYFDPSSLTECMLALILGRHSDYAAKCLSTAGRLVGFEHRLRIHNQGTEAVAASLQKTHLSAGW